MNQIERDYRMRRLLVTSFTMIVLPFIWYGWPWGLCWLIVPLIFMIGGPSRFDGYTRYARHNRRMIERARYGSNY